jgi:hypothetical protein
MTDYTIYASKRTDVSKTSREMERFVVKEDEDGALAEAARRELKGLGYRVHGVIPQQDEGGEEEATAPRTRRNGR